LSALKILNKVDEEKTEFDFGEQEDEEEDIDVQKLIAKRKKEEEALKRGSKKRSRKRSSSATPEPERKKAKIETENVMPKALPLVSNENAKDISTSAFPSGSAPMITNLGPGGPSVGGPSVNPETSFVTTTPIQPPPPQPIQPTVKGWVVHDDQVGCPPGMKRVMSTTVWLGFPNERNPPTLQVLENALSIVGNLGELSVRETFAFAKYLRRKDADVLFQAARAPLPGIPFILKPGWARAPGMHKESFDFDTGIGYTPMPHFLKQLPTEHPVQSPIVGLNGGLNVGAPNVALNLMGGGPNFIHPARLARINAAQPENKPPTPPRPPVNRPPVNRPPMNRPPQRPPANRPPRREQFQQRERPRQEVQRPPAPPTSYY